LTLSILQLAGYMQLDVRLRKLATLLTKWQVRGDVFKERGCCLLVAPLSELLVVFEPYITPPGRKVRQHCGLTNKKFDKHPFLCAFLAFLKQTHTTRYRTCLYVSFQVDFVTKPHNPTRCDPRTYQRHPTHPFGITPHSELRGSPGEILVSASSRCEGRIPIRSEYS